MDRKLDGVTMDEADARMRAALSQAGFGILTEIDVQATMKKKLNVDLRGFRILDAHGPKMAQKAPKLHLQASTMLPCNVILKEVDGGVEVLAVDPVASVAASDNDALKQVAGQVRELLAEVLRNV